MIDRLEIRRPCVLQLFILVMAVVLVAAGAVALRGPGAAAQTTTSCTPAGSVVEDAVDDVTLLRGDVETGVPVEDGDTITQGQLLTVKVDWTTSRRVAAGDYFTYQLDAANLSAQAIPGFDVVEPSTGRVVGCGTVTSAGLMTVVFNDTAAEYPELTGFTWASARVTTQWVEQEQRVTLFLTSSKSVTLRLQPGGGPGSIFRKDGWQTLPVDHQYFTPERGLSWRIVTERFDRDWDNVHIWDVVPEPTGEANFGYWKFNCGYLTGGPVTDSPITAHPNLQLTLSDGGILPGQVWNHKLQNNGAYETNGTPDPALEATWRSLMDSTTVTCADGRVDFHMGGTLPAGTMATIQLIGGFTDSSGDWLTMQNIGQISGKTFSNTAYMRADGLDMISTPVHSVEIAGGGEVTSEVPTPEPTSTSVPTTSEVPTSTTVPTTSEVPTSSEVPTTSEEPTTTTVAGGSLAGSLAGGSLSGGSMDAGSSSGLAVGSLAVGSLALIAGGLLCTGVITLPGLVLPGFCPVAQALPTTTITQPPVAPGPSSPNGRG